MVNQSKDVKAVQQRLETKLAAQREQKRIYPEPLAEYVKTVGNG